MNNLDRTAGAVRGRCTRVCNVVRAEMDNYEPGNAFNFYLKPRMKSEFFLNLGIYTERVLEAVHLLGNEVMPNFASKAEAAVDALRESSDPQQIDENEFIAASTLVYEGVSLNFFLKFYSFYLIFFQNRCVKSVVPFY